MHIQIYAELFLTWILVLFPQQNSLPTYPVVPLTSSNNIYLMFQYKQMLTHVFRKMIRNNLSPYSTN